MTKAEWRKNLKILRNELSSQEIAERSVEIMNKVWQVVQQNKVKRIHTYLPMGSEVKTESLIEKALEKKMNVAVPKTLSNRQLRHLALTSLKDLVEGKFGTYHPKVEKEYSGNFDLIIVPGLGFDRRNYRLGYGGGYYDTFLKKYPNALKVGIGYGFQLVEELPNEAHDVTLDWVIVDGAQSPPQKIL